jgi:hypothetical protein
MVCKGQTLKLFQSASVTEKKVYNMSNRTAGTVTGSEGWPLLKTMLQTSLPSPHEIQVLILKNILSSSMTKRPIKIKHLFLEGLSSLG